MEDIENISDIFVNIVIIITFFSGFKVFKYKLNNEERKLYLNSSLEIRRILKRIMNNANVIDRDLTNLRNEYYNAQLYLDNSIAEYIKKVLTKVVTAKTIQNTINSQSNLKDRERNENRLFEYILTFDKELQEMIPLYRKHIITEYNPTKFLINLKDKLWKNQN